MSTEGEIAESDSRIQETQFSRENEAAGRPEGRAGDASISNTSQPEPTTGSMKAPRVLGPDLLRGLLMVLQSIDHAAVASGAWGHGQGTEGENDGQIVDTWISPVAWTARTLAHLCAPGFMFLLGMGVVYFGKSRSKLGWSNFAMIRHFFIRAIVLALVNEFLSLVIMPGRIVVLNIVLLALAFNYLISGLLWLVINGTEHGLTTLLRSSKILAKRNADERQPLLAEQNALPSQSSSNDALAESVSFHLHNLLLLALAVVTIRMNIWMSPDNGHCHAASAPAPISVLTGPNTPSPSGLGSWFDFWFYPVWTPMVMSGFPPLAWISFALLGLLYGRLIVARPGRPAYAVNTINLSIGLLMLLLFVGTRLFHVGNLSEDCLHMPEHSHIHGSGRNQYLASFRSFFYVIKYPPSPAYLCFTMGVIFLLLAGFGSLPEKIGRRLPGLLVFGTSALFFYAVHMCLYGGLSALAKMWFGHELGKKDPFSGRPAIGVGDGPAFWVMWAIGLIIMYPLCRWYGRFKATKAPDSVWRFF